MEYPSINDEFLVEWEEKRVIFDNRAKNWEQNIETSIEIVLSLADCCKEKGINPLDVINDLIKIHDKNPAMDFTRNLGKLIFRYACKICDVDPCSVEGKKIAEEIWPPSKDREEMEIKRCEKKARIKAGLEPGHMTFYLKQYAGSHHGRDVHYTF